MGHELSYIGQISENRNVHKKIEDIGLSSFVSEKVIFNNVFGKDIRRVFIYKKTEQLAKAIHLITPAFVDFVSLKNRIDSISVGLLDAAILPVSVTRTLLSRELLTLSSLLSMAQTNGLLSKMNADIITKEAQILLQEIASYEEPVVSLDEVPTLSRIAKSVVNSHTQNSNQSRTRNSSFNISNSDKKTQKNDKGHIKDRREAILSVIKNKQRASIKDISTLIRGVSEKTIQRELLALVRDGVVLKQGERRWSVYSPVDKTLTL